MNFLLIFNLTNLTAFMSPFAELITFLFALPTFAAMTKVFFDGEVLNLELPVFEKWT